MSDPVNTLVWAGLAPLDRRAHVMRMVPQAAMASHDHLFHELALVTSGSATHVTAVGRATIGVDELIVLRPQVWHAYERPTRDFAVTNCLISPALMHQLLPLVTTVGPLFELFWQRGPRAVDVGPPVVRLDADSRAAVDDCLAGLEREQERQGLESQAIVTGIGMTLLARVARAWAGQRTTLPRPLSARAEAAVLRASAYLEAHLDEPPSLARIARIVGMAPAHLSRSFAARMGSGIVAFVHRLRAEEACRMLRLTDLSVTEIAGRLGYAEVAYFSRRFRAATGRSPRQYRDRRTVEPAG